MMRGGVSNGATRWRVKRIACVLCVVGGARVLQDRPLEAGLELDDLGDAVVHLLHSLELGEAESALVGDIVDTAFGLGVLAAGAAHLQIVLARDLLELGLVRRELRHLNVHGRAHRRAQIRRAEREEAEAIVVREGQSLLDLVHRRHQTSVHLRSKRGEGGRRELIVARTFTRG